MPAYRFPILVFRDAAGGWTATLVEDDGDVAAYGRTPAEARERMRDYLDRTYRGGDTWRAAPEVTEAELSVVRVDVRPQYAVERRVYPSGEAVAVRVAVATGRTAAGMRFAALPTLGVRFNYFDDADLRPLV